MASGPAGCVPGEDQGELDQSVPNEEPEANSGDQCAGIIDGGVDEISPVRIWNQIMEKYKVAQHCEQELERLRKTKCETGEQDKRADLQQELALAVAKAVELTAQLHSKEVQKELKEFVKSQNDSTNVLTISLSETILNNRNPLFWHSCFVRLFPRADCAEKCLDRKTALPTWRWGKTLMTRADSSLWRQDVEFVASLYNIQLRRDQIYAVEACMKDQTFSAEQKAELEKLTGPSLVANALASGDVQSVREELRKKDLEKPIETAFRKMQIIQRNVRGSEGEKDNLMPKFFALRLWSGCSSLFFYSQSA